MLRALVVLVLLAEPACADEILVAGGRRIAGTLLLSKGELVFRTSDGRILQRGSNLGKVRLASAQKSYPAAPAHVIRLSADEHVSGVFVGAQKDQIVVRAAWASRLSVPQAAVVAMTHLPGYRTVLHDNFAGKPLRLDRGGQNRPASVSPDLAAGRVTVLFQQIEQPTGANWVLDLHYLDAGKPRTVRVRLAGEGDSLTVDSGGLVGKARAVRKNNELRRLTVEHSPGSLRVVCDDEVLWYTLDAGPGALRGLRLACLAEPGKERIAGAVVVSDIAVEAAEPRRRRPPGDPGKDELWLASGDQLFGSVRRVDAGGVEIAGRFGVSVYPWKELRAWYPRQKERKQAAEVAGVSVRLEIDSGLRQEPDVLVGRLTALDSKQATLHHRRLGEIKVARDRILQIRLLSAP